MSGPARAALAALGLLACCCAPSIGRAAVTKINGTVLSLTSTADRMISYRNQQHSWQTSDGALHLMINLGTVGSGASLALVSSFDGGTTWTQMFALANTDQYSTSDGAISTVAGVTRLAIAYATAAPSGQILYATAVYDSATRSWAVQAPQTVFAADGFAASNPAIGTDSAGTTWCGFAVEDTTALVYQIQMAYAPAESPLWTNTGLVFGASDTSSQKSVRLVPYANGVGLVFQNDASMYFAYRLNAWTPGTPWSTSTLFGDLPPASQDPYDSHYSIVADANLNLYVGFVGGAELLYFMSYSSATGVWTPPKQVGTGALQAVYPQVTLSGSDLVLMVNDQLGEIVFQSSDGGATFTPAQGLVHPPPPPGVDYHHPRIEVPKPATNPMPVFRQFTSGTTDELMLYWVPALNP